MINDFRKDDCIEAAHAVFKLNPHVRTRFASADDLAEFMVNFAHTYIAESPGYCGTFGFYLTSYILRGENKLKLLATVAPSLINRPSA
jgi:hypothetical protein